MLKRHYVIRLATAAIIYLGSFTGVQAQVVQSAKPLTIIVDAGHGGEDPGAVSGDIREKDLNQRIAARVQQLAPDFNITVRRPYGPDGNLTPAQRVQAMNRAEGDVVLSVHVQKETGENKAPADYIIYSSQKSANARASAELASYVAGELQRYNAAAGQKDLVILTGSKHPAILVECGDMDKPEQLAIINNPPALDAFCRHVLSAIAKWHNRKGAAGTPKVKTK